MHASQTLPSPFHATRDASARPWPARRDADAPSTDEAIRARLLALLARQPWWQPLTASVFVHEGVVIYQGLYRRAADRAAARRLAAGLNGVKAVRDDRRPVREWQALA